MLFHKRGQITMRSPKRVLRKMAVRHMGMVREEIVPHHQLLFLQSRVVLGAGIAGGIAPEIVTGHAHEQEGAVQGLGGGTETAEQLGQ